MKFGFLLVISLALSACSLQTMMGGSPSVAPETVAPTTKNPGPSEATLGRVGETEITQKDLDQATQDEIDAINNQWAQKKLHLLWAGFEDAVNDRLIEKRPKKKVSARNCSSSATLSIKSKSLPKMSSKTSTPPTRT